MCESNEELLNQQCALSQAVITKIESVNLSNDWENIFVMAALSGGWQGVSDDKLEMMESTALIDSASVKLLAHRVSKVGVSGMYRLSTIPEEANRLRTVELILKSGMTKNKNILDLLIAEQMTFNQLAFDFEAGTDEVGDNYE